jgi:hypothetical protein
MSIFKNLEKVHAAVVVDKVTGQGNLGKAIGVLAVKAITKGLGSAEWKTYMAIFADNAAQLNLLTVEDTVNDLDYAPEARAYIVSNAVCAAATNTFTGNRVSPDFGGDLSETPDDEPAKYRDPSIEIRDFG